MTPGLQVAAERLHRDPAPGEYPDAMGDTRSGIGQQRQIVAVVLCPGGAGDDDDVAEDVPFGKEADLVQPLDGRHPVAPNHLLELIGGLTGMQRQRHLHAVGSLAAHPQQLFGAGIDLGGREVALDPTVGPAVNPLDELDGLAGSPASRLPRPNDSRRADRPACTSARNGSH